MTDKKKETVVITADEVGPVPEELILVTPEEKEAAKAAKDHAKAVKTVSDAQPKGMKDAADAHAEVNAKLHAAE
jgi:hypothetical protein